MKRYDDLVNEALTRVNEVMPWDLKKRLAEQPDVFLMDVREPAEFAMLHIPGSVNVPRGVMEQSCEWDYDETLPALAGRRDLEIVVICRSGKRSVLAADVLLQMGFANVVSLRTGVRGWNDYEQPLRNSDGKMLDPDEADVLLAPRVRSEQRAPKPPAGSR